MLIRFDIFKIKWKRNEENGKWKTKICMNLLRSSTSPTPTTTFGIDGIRYREPNRNKLLYLCLILENTSVFDSQKSQPANEWCKHTKRVRCVFDFVRISCHRFKVYLHRKTTNTTSAGEWMMWMWLFNSLVLQTDFVYMFSQSWR